jgi:hypothetical protein
MAIDLVGPVLFKLWIMLNGIFGAFTKKEIKKFNIKKTIFYTFKMLNAYFLIDKCFIFSLKNFFFFGLN